MVFCLLEWQSIQVIDQHHIYLSDPVDLTVGSFTLDGFTTGLIINASKTPMLDLSLDIASPIWPTNLHHKQKFDIEFFLSGKLRGPIYAIGH